MPLKGWPKRSAYTQANCRRAQHRRFFPSDPAGRSIAGAQVEMMVLGSGFLMNGYIIGCAATGRAANHRPGGSTRIKSSSAWLPAGLTVEQILLTHGHQDHISALAEISQATNAPTRIHSGDLALTGSLAGQIAGELAEGDVVSI